MSNINLEDYKHQIELKVRFMDLDALQHVNNARYLNFLEEARIAYSQEILEIFSNIKELNVLVARIEIDFMKPILFGEKVLVKTKVSRVGNKSFEFDSVVCTEKNKKTAVVARAIQTLVAFDVTKGTTISIPQELKDKIARFEE